MESFQITAAAKGDREPESILREYCEQGRFAKSVPVRTTSMYNPASNDQIRTVSAL